MSEASPAPVENPYERQDRRYRRAKRRDPSMSFAQYVMDLVLERMEAGKSVNPDAALTIALCNPQKFWDAAEPKARKWFKTMALKKSDRMIEYGCGSMRLGAHFVRYLDPGCFFGMDVISGFYEVWRNTIGAELAAEKMPKLGVIQEDTIKAGIAFGADIVCSNTVAVHVHPDEIDEYFDNLVRLTAKPGARLVFNAVICDRLHRFEFNSWAWPLEFYKEKLKTLDLMDVEIGRAKVKDGGNMNLVEFEYRRPPA